MFPIPSLTSLKLLGGLVALVALFALLATVRAQGYSEAEAKGDARYKGLVAQHALEVVRAQDDARAEEQAIARKLREQEQVITRALEARYAARLATTNATLRALREASDADTDFARCQPVALPDGLRVEPPATGPGDPAG